MGSTSLEMDNRLNDLLGKAVDELRKFDDELLPLTKSYHQRCLSSKKNIDKELANLRYSHLVSMNDIISQDVTNEVQRVIDYYTNIITLDCHLDKCLIAASDGTGYHCECCFGPLTYNDWKFVTEKSQTRVIVNCCGDGCDNDGTYGIYCESCYNNTEYYSDYS